MVVLIAVLYAGMFKIDMFCISEYNQTIRNVNGVAVYENQEPVKECYPIMPYFKKIKENKEKQLNEYGTLTNQISSGSSVSSSSSSSEFIFNFSSNASSLS